MAGADISAQSGRRPLERHDAAQRSLEELRAKVDALKTELSETGTERDDASISLRESERAISDSTRALDEIARRQAELQQQLANQQSELSTIQGEQATHEAALDRLLVEQYRRQHAEPLQVLLSGMDPAQTRLELAYLRSLNRARIEAFADAGRRVVRIAALRNETGTQIAELDRIVQSARHEREVLVREGEARQQTLARIGAALEVRRRELAAALGDEARMTKLVARLAALVARPSMPVKAARPPVAPPTASAPADSADTSGASSALADIAALLARYKGNLKFPAPGELVARFGVPRDGSGPAWKGWFIRTPAGTPVQAVAAGRVVFADWLRGFGNLVIIDHGDGFMSLYGNNDALLQQVGAPIESGQAVAQAGTSGGAAESGVYFELRHNGVALNPKEWFSR